MIGTSPEFQVAVRGPHLHVARVDVVRDGAVVRTLDVHRGSVDADRSNRILRRFDAQVADAAGELTPAGIRDLLAPFGVVLRLYRGVRIPVVTRLSAIDDTQAQWAAGTRSGTSADPGGDLVLGNI